MPPTAGPRPDLAISLLTALVMVACVSAQIQVVDERTALENQILGSYQQLDKNLQTLASVRAGDDENDPTGPTPLSGIRARAIQARQIQLFNRDDVDELKTAGCLGEDRTGNLQARACPLSSDPGVTDRISRMVTDENQARQTLLDFVLTTSPDLSQADRPEVQAAAVRLYRQQAAPGHWLQADDGRWYQKEGN